MTFVLTCRWAPMKSILYNCVSLKSQVIEFSWEDIEQYELDNEQNTFNFEYRREGRKSRWVRIFTPYVSICYFSLLWNFMMFSQQWYSMQSKYKYKYRHQTLKKMWISKYFRFRNVTDVKFVGFRMPDVICRIPEPDTGSRIRKIIRLRGHIFSTNKLIF